MPHRLAELRQLLRRVGDQIHRVNRLSLKATLICPILPSAKTTITNLADEKPSQVIPEFKRRLVHVLGIIQEQEIAQDITTLRQSIYDAVGFPICKRVTRIESVARGHDG